MNELPNGWQSKRILDITEIKIGRDLISESFSKEPTKKHLYPVYSNSHDNKGLYGYYNFPEYKANAVTVVGRGDIGKAFSRNGSFGAIGRLIILIPKNEINNEYLTESINYLVKFHKESSAVPQLTGKQVGNYKIPLPPFPEQQKIAKILSTVDAKIENITQQIQTTEQLKKGLMQQLLSGKYNVLENCPYTNEELKDSPLGKIPKRWEVVKVEELINLDVISEVQDGNHGESHPISKDFVEEGIPFIMANCFTKNNKLDLLKAKRISKKTYQSLRIGFSKPGDVLLTHKGTVGLTAIVDNIHGNIMLTPQVTYYRIKNDNKLKKEYLYYSFQSQFFQKTLDKLSKQSTRAYIGITNQKKLLICVPQIKEQQKIAVILSIVDTKIEQLHTKKAHYTQLKKGLMQQLLTGKIRVKV